MVSNVVASFVEFLRAPRCEGPLHLRNVLPEFLYASEKTVSSFHDIPAFYPVFGTLLRWHFGHCKHRSPLRVAPVHSSLGCCQIKLRTRSIFVGFWNPFLDCVHIFCDLFGCHFCTTTCLVNALSIARSCSGTSFTGRVSQNALLFSCVYEEGTRSATPRTGQRRHASVT